MARFRCFGYARNAFDKLNYSSKELHTSLFDIANGNGKGVCADLADIHRDMAHHLSLNVKSGRIDCMKANHAVAIFAFKNLSGTYDYYEDPSNNTQFCINTPQTTGWSNIKYSFHVRHGNLNTKETQTVIAHSKGHCGELTANLIKKNLTPILTKENIKLAYRDLYLYSKSPVSETVTWKMVNNNKNKCNIRSCSGVFSCEKREFYASTGERFQFCDGKLYKDEIEPTPNGFGKIIWIYICDCTSEEAESKAEEFVSAYS